ncbi:hypothetical protein DPSP01_013820 [Paraphaeosphaeria sporulosa]
MTVPLSGPGAQSLKPTLPRQCKVTNYKSYFAESSAGPDDLSIEDSSIEEGEDDDDLLFIDPDELGDSEEEYVPHDSSEDESCSTNSDTYYDLDDDLDDWYDLSDLYAGLWEDHDDDLAVEGNLEHAEEEEGEKELVSHLSI